MLPFPAKSEKKPRTQWFIRAAIGGDSILHKSVFMRRIVVIECGSKSHFAGHRTKGNVMLAVQEMKLLTRRVIRL